MSVVHYKFKNSLEYDSVTFDGLAISLADLKKAIMFKNRLRPGDTDLQVINAQTNEEYRSVNAMIPKNTSLTVARVPVAAPVKPEITAQAKAKKWEAFRQETQAAIRQAEVGFTNEQLKQSSDLVNAKGSEMDKIQEMIKQSTRDFDPSNYLKKFPTGTPSPNYVCVKCGKTGHYVNACPNTDGRSNFDRLKRPTGIPAEHMLVVSEALPGSYLTYSGQYAVPKIDAEAYIKGKKELPPFLQNEKPTEVRRQISIPKELRCPLCGDLLRDAVLIPCCGMSYCDECIRSKLLETDDHICPSCGTTDVSPDGLIANQSLRKAAINFQNETSRHHVPTTSSSSFPLSHGLSSQPSPVPSQAPAQRPPVVPKGPSVLDYRPPPRPAAPPRLPQLAQPTAPQPSPTPIQSTVPPVSQPKTFDSQPVAQEPPTPTLDEPPRNNIADGPVQVVEIKEIQPLATVIRGQTTMPSISIGPTGPFLHPPPVPATSFPGPGFPPPGAPPLIPQVVPPVPVPFGIPPNLAGPPPTLPQGYIPAGPPPLAPRPPAPPVKALPPPIAGLPKPLSEAEFLREKKRLIEEEAKKIDPLLEFAQELKKREKKPIIKRSRSRSWSRSSRSRSRSPRYRSRTRSRSPPRYRSRSLSRRSFSRSRSITPRKLRPRSPSSRYSRSPRRSFTPRRSWSPRKSRSRSRYRSFSRSPIRRHFSRSRSRSRIRRSWSKGKSPFRGRSFSPRYRSPLRGRSPLRRSRTRSRSRSKGRFSYKRSPKRSPLRSPRRRSGSPFRRSGSPFRRSGSPFRRSGSKGRGFKSRTPPPKKKVTPVRTTRSHSRNRSRSQEAKKENIPTTDTQVPIDKSESVVDQLFNLANKTASEIADEKAKKINLVLSKSSESVNDVREKKILEKEKSLELTNGDKALQPKTDSNKDNTETKELEKRPDIKPNIKDKTKTDSKPKSKSRSKSKEKGVSKSKGSASVKSRSPKRKKKSKSPPRITRPLSPIVPDYRRGRGRGRGRGGFRRDDSWGPNFEGRDARRDFRGPEYRGPNWGNDYRGPPPGPNFNSPPEFGRGINYRGPPPPGPGPAADFRPPDYPPPPEFRGPEWGPDFPRDPVGPPRSPPFPGLIRDGGFPRDGNFPPISRDEFGYMSRSKEEELFEKYKQLYELYHGTDRSYGFAPGPSNTPTGHTPPQASGPPPAPPGTGPIPVLGQYDSRYPDRGGRGLSPRRHRSQSPRDGRGRERRDDREPRNRDRRRDSDRRDRYSPERHRREQEYRDRGRERYSPDRERIRRDQERKDKDRGKTTENHAGDRRSPRRIDKRSPKREDSSERSSVEKENKSAKTKKEGKEKKKKKKIGEEAEKKKKKIKKEKDKGKKTKKIKKVDKEKAVKMDEEDDGKETTKKELESEISETEAEIEKDTKKKAVTKLVKEEPVSTAESESSDQEISQESDQETSAEVKEGVAEEEVSANSPASDTNEKEEIENEEDEEDSDVEESQKDASPDESVQKERRRSIKRSQPESPENEGQGEDDTESPAKKPKLEDKDERVQVLEEAREEEESSDEDDIFSKPLKDEIMLEPPEISKWEKEEEDPYHLSPEPTKTKARWKTEKTTFLPRSVIEKAERNLTEKVMKPVSVASAVSSNIVRPKSPNVKELPPVREKDSIVEPINDKPKRRVFVDSDNKDQRKVSSKQASGNIQISVSASSTGIERKKIVAPEGDLRNKLNRDKAKHSDDQPRRHSSPERRRDRDGERGRDRESDRYERESDRYRSERKSRDERDYKDRYVLREEDRVEKVTHRRVSRRESVLDEAKFVPDYDEDSDSDHSAASSDSDSSSDDDSQRKRHKHKKTKHKKMKKHKKKEKKEKKKKKHKYEKEGRMKAVRERS